MFRNIGGLELVIVLVIIVLLFGVGRISKIAGEVGSGIRAFREGLKGQEEPESEKEKKTDPEKKQE